MIITFKQLPVIVFVFLTSFCLPAQQVKFGQVTEEELMETVHPTDASAPAAVLYREVKTSYKYIQGDGFHVSTSIYEKVKIYNEAGFSYATITEKLYKNGASNESVSGLKAFTYNLENGQITKTKLSKEDTFSKSLNDYYNEEKFTMPLVKKGCILEYEYKIESPFPYVLDDFVLQYDIPIKQQEIVLSAPEYFAFNPKINGYLQVRPTYETKSGKISFMSTERGSGLTNSGSKSTLSSINYIIRVTRIQMKDVPALNEEPYVNDMDNYRSVAKFELQYVQFPESPRQAIADNWENVIKRIYENDNFGGQIGYAGFFKEDVAAVIGNLTSEAEKTMAVFNHVQQRMSWNNFTGYHTDKGVKAAYKERSGNIADINLILVSMLRAAGLQAYPVLISTRDNGVPVFPTRQGFNYVIAAVQLGGANLFLDASDKFTTSNLLPPIALNWFGKIIKEDGTFETVSVFPDELSNEINMMNVSVNQDGGIDGRIRKQYTDYRSYIFRTRYAALTSDAYLEQVENNHPGLEISGYAVDGKLKTGAPVIENFDFHMDMQSEVIGDRIYFSPLFFSALTENPFKAEIRNYPIDFNYPWQDKFMVNISIPQGYEVTSMPEPILLALEDDLGSFSFNIRQQQNGLQLAVEMKINKAVIPAHYYENLRELYKKIVEKETEKVVLTKIAGDGYSERTAGGR